MQGASEADAQALEGLLSPQGLLFKAMLNADAESLINFIFPLERLPTRTQLLLRSAPGRSDLIMLSLDMVVILSHLSVKEGCTWCCCL